ncbi:MAG: SDR family NAD(P)-dependent oxidoreductase [Gammaproteobacteria bacterium]|nr:SDR family NAD(P)-dependent oxidoreductase [Gammaproteobacteria bacterium]
MKIIWIVGASSGIGRELALQYAQTGATVYASARSVDKLNQLSTEAESLAGRILAAPLDVCDNEAIIKFVQERQREDTVPDLAIFNAGFYDPVGLEQLSLEHFEQTFDVNYMGVVRCLMALLPVYRSQRSGHLAVVASVAGYSGLPRAAAYGSTKAALINLCESLKHEALNEGIRISVVNPGFVRTPMTDQNEFAMPFLLEPQDAAQRIVRGLDSRSFEVHFPKRFTFLMKCLRLLPYPLYFALTRGLLKQR